MTASTPWARSGRKWATMRLKISSRTCPRISLDISARRSSSETWRTCAANSAGSTPPTSMVIGALPSAVAVDLHEDPRPDGDDRPEEDRQVDQDVAGVRGHAGTATRE